MTLQELLPTLRALPKGDKLRLLQFLANELAKEEQATEFFEQGQEYPVWSPHQAFDAAEQLMGFLAQEKEKPRE